MMDTVVFSAVANSPNMDSDPFKHYVTIFMSGKAKDVTQLQNNEPHKCEGWEWITWTELLTVCQSTPISLFEPLTNLIKNNEARPF
jgi:hypothetical protein